MRKEAECPQWIALHVKWKNEANAYLALHIISPSSRFYKLFIILFSQVERKRCQEFIANISGITKTMILLHSYQVPVLLLSGLHSSSNMTFMPFSVSGGFWHFLAYGCSFSSLPLPSHGFLLCESSLLTLIRIVFIGFRDHLG